MKDFTRRIKEGAGCLLVAGVVGAVTLLPAYSYFVSDTITTTINGTDVKRYSSKDKYLIFTDAGTFENTDAWYRFKFRSSDIQGQAKKLTGRKVNISRYGWRNPLSSSYPNVVGITEFKEE